VLFRFYDSLHPGIPGHENYKLVIIIIIIIIIINNRVDFTGDPDKPTQIKKFKNIALQKIYIVE